MVTSPFIPLFGSTTGSGGAAAAFVAGLAPPLGATFPFAPLLGAVVPVLPFAVAAGAGLTFDVLPPAVGAFFSTGFAAVFMLELLDTALPPEGSTLFELTLPIFFILTKQIFLF